MAYPDESNYEFLYGGTPTSLEPEYGELFTGYRIGAARIGAATSIQTANQITEVSNRLSEGVKTVEVQPLSEDVFEVIPKQHLKEINRLSKLTGSEVTVHAPMIEPSGFTDRGWSEGERAAAEEHLKSIVERSHEMNPQAHVTIHATAGLPGTQKFFAKGEEREEQMTAINQDTYQMAPLRREEAYDPQKDKIRMYEPEERLKVINESEWVNSISNLAFYKKQADEILEVVQPALIAYKEKMEQLAKGEIKLEDLTQEQRVAIGQLNEQASRAQTFLGNVDASIRNLYEKAYKFGDSETKKDLLKVFEFRKKFKEEAKEKKLAFPEYIAAESRLVDGQINALNNTRPPQLYIPAEEFAIDKSATTLGNVAFKAYKEFGEKSPIVSVENVFPGMAFSRAEELKQLIEKSREKFVEAARKEGYGESAARAASARLIGATWDIGHINLLRRAGYKEEKVIEETKKIAPYVKHVHLADNFGFSDSHLPPGMATMPTKKTMEALEKAGYKGKAIIEAGKFVMHFKVSPHPYVLEALGSPMYSAYMAPFWNQMRGTTGTYFAGYGTILPEEHFTMYGGGFAGMPVELGGQMPGKKSRLAGTPTE